MRYDSTSRGSFALVGYSINDDVMQSCQKRFGTNEDLVAHLQSLLQIPISIAQISDRSREISTMICCWVNWTDSFYDCSEMMNISVAEVFTKVVPKVIGVQGGLRRVFVREAELIRCDFNRMEISRGVDAFERQDMGDFALSEKGQDSLDDRTSSLMYRIPPLHKLSPELFLEIFDYTLYETSATSSTPLHARQHCAITLSHIDARTRAIILSSSKIWTSVPISHKRSSWELAKLCYARTNQCDLHVEVALRRSPTDFQQIALPLLAASARIKSLAMSPTLETQPLLSTLLYELNAPRLEDLTLSSEGSTGSWAIQQLPRAPNLARVSINGVEACWTSSQFQNLVALHWNARHKNWQNPRVSIEQLIGDLDNLQHLQSLVLNGLVLNSSNDLPSTIHLPALLDLNIVINCNIVLVLSSIDAPNLEQLSLDCRGLAYQQPDAFHQLPPKWFDKVTTLKLKNVPTYLRMPEISEWITNLCPNITHLVLDDLNFLDVWTSCVRIAEGGTEDHGGVDDASSSGSGSEEDASSTRSRGVVYPALTSLSRMEIVWSDYFWDGQGENKLEHFLSTRHRLGLPQLSHLCLDLRSIGSSSRPSTRGFMMMAGRLKKWVDEMDCLVPS